MTHAAARHRQMDAALAERLARDSKPKRRWPQSARSGSQAEELERAAVGVAQDRQRVSRDRTADRAYLAALAGSGDRFRDVGAALLPSRLRAKDLRSMSRPRVLLTRLSVRTSAKGANI